MAVRAFCPESSLERLDEVVRRFAWPREVEGHAALVGPEVHIARDELAALIDTVCSRIANSPTDAVEGRDDILTAVAEPRIEDRHVACEGVDNGQNPDLPPRCQLVVHEVHRPVVVRAGRFRKVFPELRLLDDERLLCVRELRCGKL